MWEKKKQKKQFEAASLSLASVSVSKNAKRSLQTAGKKWIIPFLSITSVTLAGLPVQAQLFTLVTLANTEYNVV